MRFRVIDLFVAAFNVPYAPRGDDGHFGGERLDRQFKAHLIVPLARAAVADRVGALFFGDLDDALCDDGTGKRRAEQIFVFIHRAGLHRRIDIILDEFLAEVFDVKFGRARFERLFFQPFEFALLPHVGGNGDDFAVVIILFEPGNDDGRIQPARICKDDFFDLLFHLRSFLFIKL